jgi:HK97 family phage major capsid protein
MELKEVKDLIEAQGRAWEEFKKANDAAIEAKADGKAVGDIEAKLAAINDALDKVQTKLSRPGSQGGGRDERQSPEAEAYKNAFLQWVRSPSDPERRTALQLRARELQKVESKAFGADDGFETRAAQVITSTPSAGGFALPEIIERQIARLALDISPIRQIAMVRTVGSPDYKELFDIGGAAFEWVGEGGTRNQTNTPDLAEVAPTFGMASARPQATEESLDDLFFNVEEWLITSAAEAMAAGEGAAFIAGNGTNRPTGFLAGPTPVVTADSSRAFGTLQHINSGQASALPTSVDIFLDVVHALRARYRANARWVTNKLVLSSLRKYKDTTNQYLWQPSVQAGQPASFLGYPVVEAEDMPGVTGGAFPIAYGDFREGYLIADRVGMRITRDEITQPGFVKFYVRKRVGGRLRNTQAIKLLRIGT